MLVAIGNVQNGEVATLCANEYKGLSCGRDGMTGGAVVEMAVAQPSVTDTLRGRGFNASEDGTGRGTPLVAQNAGAGHLVAAKCITRGEGYRYDSETCNLLPVTRPIGLDEEQNARVDGFGTLKARMEGGGFEGSVMTPAMQVRRLTPVECERLQGFPDGYTDIRPRGKDTPDGPRYKALGNSMAVPVMRWIGERIAEVEKLQSTERKSQ